jgi:hypothetical protein
MPPRSHGSAAPTELKKSTVSLPAELYWRFQEEQGRRRLSNQAAVAQAIHQWLERLEEMAPPREREPQNEHWHGILDEILLSSDQEAISAVQQNLLVFHRLMRNIGEVSEAEPAPTKRQLTD